MISFAVRVHELGVLSNPYTRTIGIFPRRYGCSMNRPG